MAVRILRTRGAQASPPISIRPAGGAAKPRARGIRRAAAAADKGDAVLLAALAAQELIPTHEFTITVPRAPRPRAGARRSAAAPRAASVDLGVDVAPNESAVVLVEQDGEYSWHYPDLKPTRRAAGRRGVAATKRTQVTIPIKLTPSRVAPAARSDRRGISIGGALKGVARAIVLKFVARTAASVGMKFLERNVRKGLIVMDGDDPKKWRRVSHIDDLDLPARPKLRILLWVHGTFSSTAGSFGALAATPDGRELLKQARARYDAVIGFDHSTLAETPGENAFDLVERLGRFKKPMQIDAITYSRGGLVFRSLVEQILPSSDAKPEVGQVVFVGVPNHGTLFAEPANWKTLIDVYTNLSMGAFALLKLLPAAAPTAHILSEIVSGLGAFVKYLAEVIITEAVVPGLAAQEPDGPFIRALNESGPNQPLPDSCRYLAVTSNFEPGAAAKPGAQPTGLAASFLGKLADGLVDRLMKQSNDLVVHTSSMKDIDTVAGNFIDASLDFGDSPVVYHTVYFAQAGVAQQLRGWLMDDDARDGFIERRGLLSVRPSPRSPFTRVRFHDGAGRHADRVTRTRTARARRGARKPRPGAVAAAMTAEDWQPDARAARTAASAHLKQLFGNRLATEPLKASDLAAPAAPPPGRGRRGAARRAAAAAPAGELPRARAYAPKLEAQSVQCSRIDADRRIDLVSYTQLHRSIPIFGSRTTVEMGKSKNLVAARAKLARVERVSPTPSLTAAAALGKLLASVSSINPAESSSLSKRVSKEPPPLTFFHDRAKSTWHLAYVFSDVPAVPAGWGSARRGARKPTAKKRHSKHGCATSPRERFPRLDYLVDAHDGGIVYYYSVSPTMAKTPVPVLPVHGRGVDEDGAEQKFFVREVKGGFELHDPMRKIRTYDFMNRDVDKEKPPRVPIRVSDSAANFALASTPGVSAHLNVTRVFQFYNDVLIRKGVDDKGSYVDNMVNCISPADEPPPAWGNAIWWKNKMWYGQIVKKKGKMRSLAASLDIIGHELTHGVTEHTSDLVYRDEAGALNESFSDIFGVIINNRNKGDAVYSNPDKWDWEIGPGLNDGGKPLRNMKTPSVTGDPGHTDQMKDFDPADLEEDFGGVHTFSNIHNKAAYNLLTTRTGKGKKAALVLTPDESARLFYFTLQRLDRVATFEDVLDTMLDVVKTVYPDLTEQAENLKAVTEAYAAVGIPRK